MKGRLCLVASIGAELQIAGPLPDVIYGVAYSATLRQYGGVGLLAYDPVTGLPAGLAATDNGDGTLTIAGTSTASGVYPLTISGLDAERTPVTRDFVLVVMVLPITISGDAGDMHVAASDTFSYGVTGGSGTYTGYAITSGALPDGWILNGSTGVIARDPTTRGTFAWEITVTDSLGNVSAPYADSATITYPVLTLSGTLGDAEVGHPYSSDLVIGGGDGTYSNPRVTAGTLASGLGVSIVNVGGTYKLRVSGTPTVSMVPDTITLAVDSGDGQTAYSAQSFNDYSVISLSGTFASPLYDGVAYQQDITIAGGSGGYTNARVATGSLPTGLALSVVNVSGTYKVRLSGTCSVGTTYNFTVAVDDSLGYTATSAAQSLTRQDQSFASVVALLHFDGANHSTTFTDQIGNTWTRNPGSGSTCEITTAASVFGGASGDFNNRGISTPRTPFNFGTGAFTIEVRINPNDTGVDRDFIAHRNSSDGSNFWFVRRNSSNGIRFFAKSGGSTICDVSTPASLISASTFNAVKIQRDPTSGAIEIIVGTTKQTLTGTNFASNAVSMPYPNVAVWVASGDETFTGAWYGKLDELRITKTKRQAGPTYPLASDAFPDS